jgi:hypothetical protein
MGKSTFNPDTAVENLDKLTKKDKFCVMMALTPVFSRVCKRLGIGTDTGYKWLDTPSVRKKISQIKAKSAEICDFTVNEALNIAVRVASFDIHQVVKEAKYDSKTGYWEVSYQDWDKIDGVVIKDVKPVIRDGIQVFQIKLQDRMPYVKMLLDHFKEVKPDQHLHVHMSPEELKTANPDAVNEEYQRLMGG